MVDEKEQYDQAATIFSPDGRIYQVEYAREAVKRGTTSVGLKFKDGVVIIALKKIDSNLIEPRSIQKIFKIDHHIGCASSGLVADARILVKRARSEAMWNKLTYDETIDVELLVKRICDLIRSYTQYGIVRPFGASLLICGYDHNGPELFETDTSGALIEYHAGGIGTNREQVMNFFEEHYQPGMDRDAGVALCLDAIRSASEIPLTPVSVDIGIVTATEEFVALSDEEIGRYLK